MPADDDDDFDADWSDVPWPVIEGAPSVEPHTEPEPRIAESRAQRLAGQLRNGR